MYLCCEADTERAVGLLRQYQANLTSPEEQALKTSVGKVSDIFGSQLFQALLGKRHTASFGGCRKVYFKTPASVYNIRVPLKVNGDMLWAF